MMPVSLLLAITLGLAGICAVGWWTAARRATAAHRESAACEAERRLAEWALVNGKAAALRWLPSGRRVAAGRLEPSLIDALDDPATALGAAAAVLRREGVPFRHRYAAGRGVVVGTLEGGYPTLAVEADVPAEPPADAAFDVPHPTPTLSDRWAHLIARADHPAFVVDGAGARLYANGAYARAVGGAVPGEAAPDRARPDAEPARARDDLLDANAWARLTAPNGATDDAVRATVQTVVQDQRRHFDVTACHVSGAVAALAVDVTEATEAQAAQARTLQSHAQIFDKLATAIAIYGPDRRLAFHNAAFQALWDLPAAFLEQAPREDEVLERLRSERRLPEAADVKAWQRDREKGHETRQSMERWWHLPDGQTLRVIANPGADGGLTTIFENVTEQLALERRYNALSRLQSETIDHLGEGIANFGPDGLLRLANPAFWSLSQAIPAELGAHVRLVAASAPAHERPTWHLLAERVTGLTDRRTAVQGRLERDDGQVLDYAFSPLPDGSTLAALTDITDSVNVARALQDRNVALVQADELKNAFIQHVSYELRSPLNTIIGFTQLLARAQTGPLNPRQREYADHISTSSEALMVIIDGILDLATIDAGIMELDRTEVDVAALLDQVLDGLKDRIGDRALKVAIDVADDARTFEGDPQRVRQVLFNLLSNAASHSPAGAAIDVIARREGASVAITVRDRGPGIAGDKREAVFERFMTDGANGRRGGVGLGLSLVKSFVELHGGTVCVAETDGPGAAFVVRFPRAAPSNPAQQAA